MNYKNQIEALLFASGRLMDVDTLVNLTGASSKQVISSNVEKLIEEYNQRDSPLMVVQEADGWKLTVREAYLPMVRKIVSETELPKTVLETLAVIAWKNPILQSDVVEIRHNKAYEHISHLEELGFIRKEPQGRTYLLNLTEKFFEYFDVEGAKDIREVFNKVVGYQDQTKVDDFDSQVEEVDAEEQLKKLEESGEVFTELEEGHDISSEEFGELGEERDEQDTEESEDSEFSELDDAEEKEQDESNQDNDVVAVVSKGIDQDEERNEPSAQNL